MVKPETISEVLVHPGAKALFNKADLPYYTFQELKYKKWVLDFCEPDLFWSALQVVHHLKAIPLELGQVQQMKFSWWHTPTIMEALPKLDACLKPQLTNLELAEPEAEYGNALLDFMKYESVASCQLEGAQITTQEAINLISSGSKAQNINQLMVVNTYAAMQWVGQQLETPFSADFICQLHQIITAGTLENPKYEGHFKQQDNIVVANVLTGELIHQPPALSYLPDALKALAEFLNNPDHYPTMPVLLKAMVLHFMVGYLHPFQDGNGRTARVLFYWYCLKNGYSKVSQLALSKSIQSTKNQYYKAYILTEQHQNDLNHFLHYHIKVLLDAANEAGRTGQHPVRNAASLLLQYPDLNRRQVTLLQQWERQPDLVVSIGYYQKQYKVVYQTARTDLLTMQDLGLAKVRTEGKRMLFLKQ